MRVFLTGATGFIGSAIADELATSGHQVVALARSDASAAKLSARGFDVYRGDLHELDSLRSAAAEVDGVIHAAFTNISATTTIDESTRVDRAVVAALGDALAGSGRPLVVTSVTSLLRPGARGTEDDEASPEGNPRGQAEIDALALLGRGVQVTVVRLPPSVHGEGDVGWVPALIRIAKTTGVAGYIADGKNRWPAVHRLDAARLFRLALESPTLSARLHAVADEGVPFRAIATAVSQIAGVPTASIAPEGADAQFGFLGRFASLDSPRSSARTRAALRWNPNHPSLLEDLASGIYTP